jgi:hypothetical protein
VEAEDEEISAHLFSPSPFIGVRLNCTPTNFRKPFKNAKIRSTQEWIKLLLK